MTLKSIYISTILLFITSNIWGYEKMSIEKIFKLSEEYYGLKDYSYGLKYFFFENPKSKTVIETKNGLIVKNKNISYQRLDNMETMNSDSHNYVFNHESKIIQVQKREKNPSLFFLKSFLNVLPIKKIIEDNNYWICELSNENFQLTTYHKVRFYFRKTNYSLYKQVFFFKGKQELLKNKKKILVNNPRLEILLEEISLSKVKKEDLTQLKNYVTFSKGKTFPSKKYKNYKLITL